MKCSHTAAHAAVIEGAAGQDCGPVSSSLQMQHMDHMRPPDSPAAHALPTDRALEHVGRRRRRGGGACALQAPALWPPFLLGAPACALSRYLCLYALREVIGASGSPLHRCRCLHPGLRRRRSRRCPASLQSSQGNCPPAATGMLCDTNNSALERAVCLLWWLPSTATGGSSHSGEPTPEAWSAALGIQAANRLALQTICMGCGRPLLAAACQD